jgi:DNA-binding PadR family transcriptional regulator
MGGRDQLGEFEERVLLAVLRLGGEAYSVPIVSELEERTGREVAPAAVYIVLRRLEEKGLVESRFADEAGGPGRPRRYFTPTRPGIRMLRESRYTRQRLWEGLEPLLDEVP